MAATGRIELRRDLTAKFDLVFKPVVESSLTAPPHV